MENSQKVKVTLKKFDLPNDRHYVKVGQNVLKFMSKFIDIDGSEINRWFFNFYFLEQNIFVFQSLKNKF